MTKAQLKSALREKGISFDESATVAELQALLAGSEQSDNGNVWVLPKRQPRKEHGFRLPVVDTPSVLGFAVGDNGKPAVSVSTTAKNKDREMINLSLGDEHFLMWLDAFQGNLAIEQERLDKAGIGFKVFSEVDGNIVIDKSVEFTCNGRALTVNA